MYAARALRLLGQPAVVATKIADEDRPRLAALGLPVVARSAARTIGFRIENDGARRRLEIDELGEPWSEADVRGWVGEALAGCDWVHAGALTRGDFGPGALAALRRGRKLSFDGQGLVRVAASGPVVLDADYDPDLLRHVDLLKLADEELEALGCELDERSLATLGVREIVVTLGREGAVVYADGLAEHVPTFPLEGVDPTGAGDAWTAAYVAYRRRRHSPVSAARLANGAASALLGRWPVR
ncbi:MAG TPA: carbohydrate kinase family protein [Gaiellaceae bacterium]|nr:carbohydrate kinase family protein [Gaiellaceae bacterium]